MTTSEKPIRPIRSYVLRQGRITPSQQQARSEFWPLFGLESGQDDLFDWFAIFARQAPVVLEIGFGMGDSLVEMARAEPEKDFVGIEVHQPGIGRILANAKAHQLTNLKVIATDAIDVLTRNVGSESLDKVLLLFPDPWPKTKHHKRRIVSPEFAALIASKLKIGGQFHLATDWQPYAEHMLAVLDACSVLQNQYGQACFAPQNARLETKFERRGQNLGHAIRDLIYIRVK